MGEAHGIEVATADKEAWDAALSSFRHSGGSGVVKQTLSLVAGRNQSQPREPLDDSATGKAASAKLSWRKQ